MNEGLLKAYYAHPTFSNMLQSIKKNECVAIYEMAQGESPLLVAALANATKRPIVFISPSTLLAQHHAQDISAFFPSAYLPPRDIQFSRAAVSRESTYTRLETLNRLATKQTQILCLSIEAMLDRCASKEAFLRYALTLEEGKRAPLEDILSKLITMGYERLPMVEGKGQFSLRGDLLDIYPPNNVQAIRIEFFDDEIDSIRFFDCISQRSIERTKRVQIGPATECLIENKEEAAKRFEQALMSSNSTLIQQIHNQKENLTNNETEDLEHFLNSLDVLEALDSIDQLANGKPKVTLNNNSSDNEQTVLQKHINDIDKIANGHVIKTAPMWLHTLLEKTVFPSDYLENPIIVCEKPEQFTKYIQTRVNSFVESYEKALTRLDAVSAQANELFTKEDVFNHLKQSCNCIFSTLHSGLSTLKPTAFFSMDSKETMPYESRLAPLCEDIKTFKEDGLCILLCVGGKARGERLVRALQDQHMPSTLFDSLEGNIIVREVILLPITYHKGFINKQANICLLSDSDLFGSTYQRARKKSSVGQRIASFTDLSTGDYVVHDLHGVGIFQGIIQKEIDLVKRDYLAIQYANNDKLFVPADQFDRISKYIGTPPSKLNSLGGGEWKKQTGKVKAKLKELAFDLAALYKQRAAETGYAFSSNNPWEAEFADMFPYELTFDQVQSIKEIEQDMESPRNMDRLLCGDVGYGKTEVALRAAFKAVTDGKQVAFLAPTTVLVQQHYRNISKRFSAFPVRCEMISRFYPRNKIKTILEELKKGEIDIIVGTHRLLSKDVEYSDLGLLIIDEEHRFGVGHKEKIKQLKHQIDVLTLSATPIPRTLHMSMSGIRDMSLLETPPAERLPIKTYVIEYEEKIIADAITKEMARGGQIFFLYNRVQSMPKMLDRLKLLVPTARIGIAHGQMKSSALEDVMLDFYSGAYDVLLCSTIIENGLDVPDANTLIVFDADRFGLSQLYQLRGRVGRSNKQAYAYFTTRLNKQISEVAQKRLSALREFTEFGAGHRIAMRDMEIRGAGDVLGPEQSGHLSAIGYDMYLKLIEEAVSEVQGNAVQNELDTRVELNINAFLPSTFIKQERLRMEVYKRIAMIKNEDSYHEITEELIDRFGNIPPETNNLMRIAQMRGIAQKLGISLVTLGEKGILFRFNLDYMPNMTKLMEAIAKAGNQLHFVPSKTPTLLLPCNTTKTLEMLLKGILALTDVLKQLSN